MTGTLGCTLAATFLLIVKVSILAETIETKPATNAQLTIRVWDRAQLGSEIWNRATAVVDRVIKPVGIQLIWLHCAVGETPENLACSSPTGSNDISLRVYQRTKADLTIKGRSRGGTSQLLSPEGGKGIIYVFSDRVTEVSQLYKLSPELVLGITVAHEIGHLLLPHQPHSLAGIMRASLNAKDWRLAAQGLLGFVDSQRQTILAGVEARSLAATLHASRDVAQLGTEERFLERALLRTLAERATERAFHPVPYRV
jgi:hypothetical protein